VVSQPWLDRLAEGTDRLMSGSGADRNLSRPGEGRFFGDLFAYKTLARKELRSARGCGMRWKI